MSSDPNDKPTWLQRMERRLADRMARRHLEASVGARPGNGRSGFWWTLLASVLVLPVHALTLVVLVGGIFLLVTGDNAGIKAAGVGLLLVAVGVRPTVARRVPHTALLRRTDAPRLFGLLEEVATTNLAPMPAEVLIFDEFNAFAGYVGWRRRRVLGIGAPLWVAAPPQARVALLGHELGHFAHGDVSHGLWVGTAWQTLAHWHDICGGSRLFYEDRNFIERFLMAPLRGLVMAYLVLLTLVNAQSSHRREYLADLDAARAAGTPGAVTMLDVTINEPTVAAAMTRAAVSPHRPEMWPMVSGDIAALSVEDFERRRAGVSTADSRINDTHPASPLRVQLLQRRAPESASVVLDTGRSAAIDQELAEALALAAKEAGERIRFQW